MAKILIAEDDPDLVRVVRDWLTMEKHVVQVVDSGGLAWEALRSQEFDLVILDLGLPEMDGMDVLKNYREHEIHVPILILTGRNTVYDKVKGLDLGADDYLTKPFHIKELTSRVNALLRRSLGQASDLISAGRISVDLKKRRATKDGAELKLTPAEYSLLEFLVKNPNQPFTSEALLQRVWSNTDNKTTDTVRKCINRVRNRIGDTDKENPIIETLHSVGYRLNADDRLK